jgi:hypothetical protein
VNTLGIPQAHPAPVKRKRPISYMLYLVELKSLFIFLEKGSCCKVFPKDLKVTKYSTATELPAPVALFSLQHAVTHTFPCLQRLYEISNCQTTPDSSIPVDTDYSNRFQLCAVGYNLPTSPVSAISPSRDPNAGSLSSPVRPNLNDYPERVRPPPCPNRTKNSPSLSSWCSPAFITLGLDRTSLD